ncbi:ChaN family lipoprotein [Halobacteriovorax sp. HLS]|uniref:ChaN family lipoprotein n=1 Tax=Halobacteriovorax sp. HLS TaxID=2234000 RepID=UPI000FDB4B1E|nr:ChaN family lipoprotein [Halobacteriovorax sp. HLS]
MTKLISFLLFFTLLTSTQAATLEEVYTSTKESLILIGESHKDDVSRQKVRESLSAFKEAGGEILALEMIESHKQYLLDNFEANLDGSQSMLSEYLTKRWQYNTESYMQLISEARRLDLRLIAIDLDKTQWPRETTVYPVIPDISKVRAAREAHMSEVLCEYKEVKTIVLIGSFHTYKRFLPSALESSCAMESASIILKDLLKSVFLTNYTNFLM